MTHIHPVPNTDSPYVINPETRQIVGLEKEVMQYDHNSERLTFELPRLIDGHDMSLCNRVEVHYINVEKDENKQNTNVYFVDDLEQGVNASGEDIVTFSWLLSQGATMYAGPLNFVIKFSCLTGTIVEYVWNTAILKGVVVSEGWNNSNALIEVHTDVLAEWERKMTELMEKVESVEKSVIGALEGDY